MSNGTPYSPEEDAQIRAMCAVGKSNRQIAARLDRSVESIARHRRRLLREGEPCEAPLAIREASARFVADGVRVLGALSP